MTNLEIFSKIYLPNIKKSCPKTCSFMSVIKSVNGNYYLQVVYKHKQAKEKVKYSLPEDFVFTQADLKHIRNMVVEKCQSYVTE